MDYIYDERETKVMTLIVRKDLKGCPADEPVVYRRHRRVVKDKRIRAESNSSTKPKKKSFKDSRR